MNCCTLTEAVNRLMLPDNIELPPELDYDLYLSVVLSALEAWPGQDKVKFAAMGASFFAFNIFTGIATPNPYSKVTISLRSF